MKNWIKLFVFICCSVVYNVYGQTGEISGIIIDSTNNETLIGVNAVVVGTTNGATTDLSGEFKIHQLTPGIYNLNLSIVGYKSKMIERIVVNVNETKFLRVVMVPNINILSEAIVTGKKITHTENAVFAETRKAEQIVVGVSSQLISKTQDRNATEVLKRLPGISIQEDRFIMVRGLSDRYNAVMINDVSAPSTESDKRAFSFDIIPSIAIDKMMVYKSGTSDLPGDFSGGTIKIYTKSIPEEEYIQAGYGLGIRTGTTFKDFYANDNSPSDLLGIDRGKRDLPDYFPSNVAALSTQEQVKAAKSLPNSWLLKMNSTPIDEKFNFGFAKLFKIGKYLAANITQINYSKSAENRSTTNINYNAYDVTTKKSDTIYSYIDNSYSSKVNWSALSNFSLTINDNNKIDFRNFYNQSGTNDVTIRQGENKEEGNLVRNYAFRYKERSVYAGQLGGTHTLKNNHTTLNWKLGLNYIIAKEPDYRRVRIFNSVYDNDTNYIVQINSTASQQDAGRFFSKLNESTYNLAMTGETEFVKAQNSENIVLKYGIGSSYTDRLFSARWMSYKRANFDLFDYSILTLPINEVFSEQNINDSTGFKIDEGTNGTDRYMASNFNVFSYVSIKFPIGSKIIVNAGLRTENNNQTLNSKNNNGNKIEVNNLMLTFLPSMNFGYSIDKKSKVRASYFMSVNRPEFRELAPYAYYDFIYNNVLKGNPDLKTPIVHNEDLKYEFYPTEHELISFGVFHKLFIHPIEQYFEPGAGSGGTRNFIFNNADHSNNYGFEFELKKSLQNIVNNQYIKGISISSNLSYIISEVKLGEQAKGQNKSRPMMGQSPYAINMNLFYTSPKKDFQMNLLYNIIGKRVYAVGTTGTPDVYEMPRNSFDFTMSKKLLKNAEIKIGVQDILNESYVLKQDSNENGNIDGNDETLISYKRGSLFSLGINVKI